MKTLLIIFLIGFLVMGCSSVSMPPAAAPGFSSSSTAAPEGGVDTNSNSGLNSLSRQLAITVKPPAVLLVPGPGTPAIPYPTPTPLQPPGWQSFTRSDWGVAVDYPRDWSVAQSGSVITFSSPQGSIIQLSLSAEGGPAGGGRACSALVNSYSQTINACGNPSTGVYTGSLRVSSSRVFTLSTGDGAALEVYREMLNSLRTTP